MLADIPGLFKVTYRVTAINKAEARKIADGICLEQTLEFPKKLVRDQVALGLIGQLRNQVRSGHDTFYVTIEYKDKIAGGELPQLLNLIFGNTSLVPGVRVERLHLSPGIHGLFKGPRFGRKGLRELVGATDRALLCSAIKPMGLNNKILAEMAGKLAAGGIDLVKDDHGLANQSFNLFEDRVKRCADAVNEANQKTGGRTLFVANVTGKVGDLEARAAFAKEAGAGALLVAPGLVGFDAMRSLAEDDSLGLLILCHPALLGSHVINPTSGMSHHVTLGQLPRLAGADGVIFPSFGGRFSFSELDCKNLVDGTKAKMSALSQSFPMPAGGLTLERVPELMSFYGQDAVFVIGGDLHQAGDLIDSCIKFKEAVSS
jgi:S-methyl-5-thioribulose 1-phosphate isomerase